MIEETIKAKEVFERKTGIKVLSLRKYEGSMKYYYGVTLSETDPKVKAFADQYYGSNSTRNLSGVEITFMGARGRRGDKIRFDVLRHKLLANQ